MNEHQAFSIIHSRHMLDLAHIKARQEREQRETQDRRERFFKSLTRVNGHTLTASEMASLLKKTQEFALAVDMHPEQVLEILTRVQEQFPLPSKEKS